MLHFIIIALIVIGLLTGVGCKVSTTKSKIENTYKPNDSMPNYYSKSEIEKLLKNLSKSDPKKLENIGAMCYEMAMPPERADYVCPTCGEKTIYTTHHAEFVSWQLNSIRESVKNIKTLDCKLDELQFCKKCSPNIEIPELCLIVKIDEEKEHKTCGISELDVIILSEFLSGSDIHTDFYDAQEPLKNYQTRIEELIGVSQKK